MALKGDHDVSICPSLVEEVRRLHLSEKQYASPLRVLRPEMKEKSNIEQL